MNNRRPFIKQTGFTLIELVAVMVLLGILAAYAVPRFGGTDTFDAYAAQDQIIAGARLAQQRAMYDHSVGACYSLDITNGGNGDVIRVLNAANVAVGPSPEWRAGIVINPDVPLSPQQVFFNADGSPVSGCPGVLINPTITIGSPVILNVCITSAGYIHACP